MKMKPGMRDLGWTAGGMIMLVVITLLALHYHRVLDTATKYALRARRIELVEGMRVALSSAAETEKSAVMATTDPESQEFADQSRAFSDEAERGRDELKALLAANGTSQERDLLDEVSRALDECRKIDRELLALAVKNANLKAYGLAFGSAADTLAGMDDALSRIITDRAASAAPESRQVMLHAAGAQSGALRIQAWLAPHISEQSDARMDELEAKMATEDQRVRADLAELSDLLGSRNRDLATARAGYAAFAEFKARILELSRQNTNIRSLLISLNEKRIAVQVCQEALAALARAIREEPVADPMAASPR